MDAVASKLLEYFQKNTLWQFFSRDWDREENLNGMFDALSKLVRKEPLPRETPMEKVFYADAVVLIPEIAERVPGFAALSPEAALAVLEEVKKELWDIVITNSKNEELSAELY
jgi:hypothetical protein